MSRFGSTGCQHLRRGRGRVQLRLSWLRILTRYWMHRSLNELPVQSFPWLGRSIINRCRLPIVWKPHQRKGSTSPFRPGKCQTAGCLQGNQLRLTPSLKASACTRCHIRLVPLPNRPSFWTYRVCESYPRVEGQSTPQRDEPGSMSEASRWLFVGPRSLVRGGCTWFPHRLRTY